MTGGASLPAVGPGPFAYSTTFTIGCVESVR